MACPASDGAGCPVRSRVSHASIGSTGVPYGNEARSRPAPSTRKMSDVCDMP